MKAKPMGGGVLLNTATSVFNITTTLFSLVVMYFLYLYSNEKITAGVVNVGWELLRWASKWYLIIVIGIFALFAIIAIIMMLISFFLWFGFFFRRQQ